VQKRLKQIEFLFGLETETLGDPMLAHCIRRESCQSRPDHPTARGDQCGLCKITSVFACPSPSTSVLPVANMMADSESGKSIVHLVYFVYLCVFFLKATIRASHEPGASCSESMFLFSHYTISVLLNK